ncbi:MAG: response regulator transcription factor [Cyanobacteria bacterium P01_G01_bin.49]
MDKVRVVLIEDHDLTRLGLNAALQKVAEIDLIGDAANGRQGLELIAESQPDVAIIDIGLPDIDGIELTSHLRKIQRENNTDIPHILILTMQNSEDTILAAFAAGADSYSLKDISIEKLVEAVKTTSEGNSWIDPAIARVVLQQAQTTSTINNNKVLSAVESTNVPENELTQTQKITSLKPELQDQVEAYPLTERELEVLELIVAGCNNADIAEKLFITVGTVKTHVRNILNKLCVNDRTQAAVRALRSGLVD